MARPEPAPDSGPAEPRPKQVTTSRREGAISLEEVLAREFESIYGPPSRLATPAGAERMTSETPTSNETPDALRVREQPSGDAKAQEPSDSEPSRARVPSELEKIQRQN